MGALDIGVYNNTGTIPLASIYVSSGNYPKGSKCLLAIGCPWVLIWTKRPQQVECSGKTEKCLKPYQLPARQNFSRETHRDSNIAPGLCCDAKSAQNPNDNDFFHVEAHPQLTIGFHFATSRLLSVPSPYTVTAICVISIVHNAMA